MGNIRQVGAALICLIALGMIEGCAIARANYSVLQVALHLESIKVGSLPVEVNGGCTITYPSGLCLGDRSCGCACVVAKGGKENVFDVLRAKNCFLAYPLVVGGLGNSVSIWILPAALPNLPTIMQCQPPNL
jgi:hypothetical protein